MVQGVSSNSRFLVRFQYGCEKDMNSNQLIVMRVDRIPVTEESKVPMISSIPDNTFDFGKGFYHGVYVLLQFNKGVGVDSNKDQEGIEEYIYMRKIWRT